MKRLPTLTLIAAAVVLSLCATAFAQQGLPSCSAVSAEIVQIPVSVMQGGRFVPFSSAKPIELTEAGRSIPIDCVQTRPRVLTVGFVIDVSPSMLYRDRGKVREVQFGVEGVRRFFKDVPDGSLFVDVVGQNYAEVIPPTKYSDQVSQALDEITAIKPKGNTALYDGVVASLEKLSRQQGENKALIIYSDGKDNVSVTRLDKLRDLVRKYKIPVHVIDCRTPDEGLQPEPPNDSAQFFALMDETGGLTLAPRNAQEVADAFALIASGLRSQVVIGAKFDKKPGVHKVKVQFASKDDRKEMRIIHPKVITF